MAFFAIAAFISCKKDGGTDVSNSIFGIYEKTDNTAQWWENLLFAPLIKVSPGTANYIEITTDYNSPYPIYTTVFDSVQLFEDNSFKVDQIVKYAFSATGYAKATGTGNFGTKTISMNFSLQAGDSAQGVEKIVMTNVKKISN